MKMSNEYRGLLTAEYVVTRGKKAEVPNSKYFRFSGHVSDATGSMRPSAERRVACRMRVKAHWQNNTDPSALLTGLSYPRVPIGP